MTWLTQMEPVHLSTQILAGGITQGDSLMQDCSIFIANTLEEL